MLLNNESVNQKSKEEMKKKKKHGNKWKWKYNDPKPLGAARVVLGGKYMTIQAYIRKQEKSQINNLTLHLMELEKE